MINYEIIKTPIITEKTTDQKGLANQVSFEVERSANRVEIKRAIEQIFNVRVAKVRTIQMKGKRKRQGRIMGKRKDWKKAVISLMPGERIESLEGA